MLTLMFVSILVCVISAVAYRCITNVLRGIRQREITRLQVAIAVSHANYQTLLLEERYLLRFIEDCKRDLEEKT